MRGRKRIRIAVDCLMTVVLLLLMGFHITGQAAHEWLGMGMFLLWAVHIFLNRKWYGGIFRGGYTPYRMVQTVVNVLLLLCVAGLAASGAALSRHALAFLDIGVGTAWARRLHLFASNWGFLLMSVHIGLHWNRGTARMRRKTGAPLLPCAIGVLIAGYGAVCFWRSHMAENLFLRSEFAYFDYEQTAAGFFISEAAVMGLFILLASCLRKAMVRKKHRREEET